MPYVCGCIETERLRVLGSFLPFFSGKLLLTLTLFLLTPLLLWAPSPPACRPPAAWPLLRPSCWGTRPFFPCSPVGPSGSVVWSLASSSGAEVTPRELQGTLYVHTRGGSHCRVWRVSSWVFLNGFFVRHGCFRGNSEERTDA